MMKKHIIIAGVPRANVQGISAKIAPFIRAMMDSGEY